MTSGQIHCSVSISRFASELGLSTSEKLVLCLIWLAHPDPFADRPRVLTSYSRLAGSAGMSRVSVPRIVLRLIRLGCLTRLHTTPSGTAYVLERPEHTTDDVDLNPFAPGEASTLAESVAELVMPRVLDRVRNKQQRRARRRPPAVKPSMIAIELEHMAGVSPKVVDGKQVPSIRFAGKGAAHVRAAQRWISTHGIESYREVITRARGHVFAELVEPGDRLYLFDRPRSLAEIEGKPKAKEVPCATETDPGPALAPVESKIEITDEMRAQWPGVSDTDLQVIFS